MTYKVHTSVELVTSPVLTDLSSGFEIDGSGIFGVTGRRFLIIDNLLQFFMTPFSSTIVSLNTILCHGQLAEK
jgi:hypothetical protein